MRNLNRRKCCTCLLLKVAFVLVLFSISPLKAQSVPADLLDLSIEELFKVEVSDDAASVDEHLQRWQLSLKYQNSEFDHYHKGTDMLTVDEVLFSPGEEARTDDNFPVVPTTIVQEVYAFIIGYDFSERTTLRVALPYVRQSTDHISIVPGYSAFNLNSNGIGDVSVLGTFRLASGQRGGWQVGAGISLPTGSIDQTGDTPRAPGDQQLPYTMQLGSGTFDIPFHLTYQRQVEKINWGGELVGKIRLGENDRNYRLGNIFMISSWLSLNSLQWVQPSIEISYKYWERIHGLDTELLVPGAFSFPAPVTNPALFGGKQAELVFGLKFPLFRPDRYIEFEFGKPFYQSLNGPQTGAEFHFEVTLGLGF